MEYESTYQLVQLNDILKGENGTNGNKIAMFQDILSKHILMLLVEKNVIRKCTDYVYGKC